MVHILWLILSAAFLKNIFCLNLPNSFNETDVLQLTKNIIEQVTNTNLEVNIACIQQLGWFIENLKSSEDGMWALKMIDSTAKIPAGLLTGNLAWLGNYDECLAIEVTTKDVNPQYCLTVVGADGNLNALQVVREQYEKLSVKGSIQQYPLHPSFGICIPDKCNIDDIKRVLNHLVPTISFAVTCQTKDDLHQTLDTGAIFTIIYFGFFILLMTVSTTYDLLRDKRVERHPLLIAFSVHTNVKRLFNTRKNPNEFSCLNGLRFISMLWVIIAHYFSNIYLGPLTNPVDALQYMKTTKSLTFVNGVYSVDTFLVITGFLVVCSFMRATDRGQKFNIIHYYLHRYVRLTPPLIPVVLSTIFLIKYLGSGPYYPQTALFSEDCRNNWWSTLLYIENYVNVNHMCLSQTWYLNVDWQLYLIAPVFLLFLPKHPSIGLFLILFGTIGSMVATFVVTWDNKIPALMNNFYYYTEEFFDKYYAKTHTRAATWFIGGFLGYILHRIKFNNHSYSLKVPKLLVGINWIIVLATLPVCLFAGLDELNTKDYSAYSNALYNTFARPAWGICIAWIIFACIFGYGGIINSFLSLPMFQVLNRFTYSMYLLHLTLLDLTILAVKQPVYFSLFNIAYSFWGLFALTFGLSLFWVLAFESPIPVIERYLLGGSSKQTRKKQQENINTQAESTLDSKSTLQESIETEP